MDSALEIISTILIAGIVLIFIVMSLAYFNNKIDDSWRQQIADHGCAEFYLDEKQP